MQLVKNLPANARDIKTLETWIPSLCRENSLEEGRAAHFSILAWKIP